MAYWTDTEEDRDVYHTDPHCPRGTKIKPENKHTGTPPAGRYKCKDCS